MYNFEFWENKFCRALGGDFFPLFFGRSKNEDPAVASLSHLYAIARSNAHHFPPVDKSVCH